MVVQPDTVVRWHRDWLRRRWTRRSQQRHHGRPPIDHLSLIGSVGMLLTWLGERRGDGNFIKAADLIERALDQTIAKPETRTPDLGGPLGTKAFGERIAATLRAPVS